MPTWAIVLLWAVVAAVAIGALLERRRGHRGAPDPTYDQGRGEAEMRLHNRGHQGGTGGL